MFSSVSWRGYRAVLLEQMYRFFGLQTTNRRLEMCQPPVDTGIFRFFSLFIVLFRRRKCKTHLTKEMCQWGRDPR